MKSGERSKALPAVRERHDRSADLRRTPADRGAAALAPHSGSGTKTETKKAAARESASADDDGIVEFDEPRDVVGVSGRSKSLVKLAVRDDAHGKKHKGRLVRQTPLNASWRPYKREPWRRGYVSVAGHGKSWSGYLVDKNGAVPPAARRELSEALASWRTGREMLIDDRLLALVADVSDEFGGRPIRVVSGYRETSYAPGSKHKVGQAFDFSVPGVPNEVLRDFLRTLPDVGVGFYPNSTHVHLDVREKPCYWVDYSTPGAHPMYAWDRRVARMSPKERLLAAELDALASQHTPLGRPATEAVQRRAPIVTARDDSRAKSAVPASHAAFAPVELANPSSMMFGSDASAPHAATAPADAPSARDAAEPSPRAAFPAPEADAGRGRDAGGNHDGGLPSRAVGTTPYDAGATR
ncbi:MAG TPA: DUF882 domain-containing protein [Polyangiaceae bacterium]|nr:DUF882 domain-containing protein [Polyangiaceae bacterium]